MSNHKRLEAGRQVLVRRGCHTQPEAVQRAPLPRHVLRDLEGVAGGQSHEHHLGHFNAALRDAGGAAATTTAAAAAAGAASVTASQRFGIAIPEHVQNFLIPYCKPVDTDFYFQLKYPVAVRSTILQILVMYEVENSEMVFCLLN